MSDPQLGPDLLPTINRFSNERIVYERPLSVSSLTLDPDLCFRPSKAS